MGTEPTSGPSDAKSDPGKQVEALFTRMMIKEMRKAMPQDGPFSGKEMSMYMDLLDDSLAERIAESGSMGIAKQMNRHLQATDGHHLRSDTSSVPSIPSHKPTHLLGHDTHAHHHHHAGHLPGGDSNPLSGKVTSTFGKRIDPITGKARLHKGLDIAAAKGTAIQSVRAGTVTFAGEKGGYGKVVYVDHGDGLETRYAHCSEILVKTGEKISQGQTLAEVGSTGRSTGNHLHFEARKDGVAIDPESIFNWRDEKSTKTKPQLVRQSRSEGLQVSTVTRGTP
jgi:murein DD-endopeptidase MepM/ murein hydrolase activator NlpD